MRILITAFNRVGDRLFTETDGDRRRAAAWRRTSARIAGYFPCPAPPPCVQRWAHRTAHRLPRWLLTPYGIAGYVVAIAVIASAVQS